MSNTAFLDYAGNTRMLFLASCGFTVSTFTERQIGPVILEDRLTYSREIRLLEPFAVDIELAAATNDGRRFRVRNRFLAADDRLCATVDSVGVWFDLAARRPMSPPDDLRDAWASLPHTQDFENWD